MAVMGYSGCTTLNPNCYVEQCLTTKFIVYHTVNFYVQSDFVIFIEDKFLNQNLISYRYGIY